MKNKFIYILIATFVAFFYFIFFSFFRSLSLFINYGFFQLRQPAINEINRIYNLNKINLAEELINNIDAQVEYTVLFIKHLKDNTKNEKEMISAYNIGLSNVKKVKYGKYYSKILKTRGEINEF